MPFGALQLTDRVPAAVEADKVTFVVGNGISANRYRVADVHDTMQQLGYRPLDDAWASRKPIPYRAGLGPS